MMVIVEGKVVTTAIAVVAVIYLYSSNSVNNTCDAPLSVIFSSRVREP